MRALFTKIINSSCPFATKNIIFLQLTFHLILSFLMYLKTTIQALIHIRLVQSGFEKEQLAFSVGFIIWFITQSKEIDLMISVQYDFSLWTTFTSVLRAYRFYLAFAEIPDSYMVWSYSISHRYDDNEKRNQVFHEDFWYLPIAICLILCGSSPLRNSMQGFEFS